MNGAGKLDIFVMPRVGSVEEKDINAVSVVGRADGSDVFQRSGAFSPRAAGHRAGVINEEDSIEAIEKCIGIVCCARGGDSRSDGATR